MKGGVAEGAFAQAGFAATGEKRSNPRFVVINLDGDAQTLYEKIYWARGESCLTSVR